MIKHKLTGKKRYRVQSLGCFKRRQILVLQYEVEGFVPEYYGGPSVEGSFKTWWVDAKPEWELSYDKS
jgi:hypothetical protein